MRIAGYVLVLALLISLSACVFASLSLGIHSSSIISFSSSRWTYEGDPLPTPFNLKPSGDPLPTPFGPPKLPP